MAETSTPTENNAVEASAQPAFHAAANHLLTLAMTPHSTTELLHETLEEALRATGGLRAFLARIEQETGELVVIVTAGEGWNPENQRIRLQLHNAHRRGITGLVAVEGKPYLTPDVRQDPHYLEFFQDVKSEVAVPFFDAQGRTRGVLNVESDRPDAFDEADRLQLTTFANIAATTLAFEEYRARERMLIEIGMDLAATTEIEPLMQRVVEVTAQALRCEGCSVFLLEEDGHTLVLRASRSGLRSKVGEASYQVGEGLTGSVARTGETIRLKDPREDPRWLGRHAEFAPDSLGAFMAVPIVGRNRILGVLRVLRAQNPSAWFQETFTEGDERVVRTVASQLGTAMENVHSFNKLVRSERMAAWGELSAKSAHIIGNRTFAIKGDLNELKFLLDQHADPRSLAEARPEIVALVGSIEHGVSRLEEILREFRDFVMATQLNRRETDINQVVREVVAETFPRRTELKLEQVYAKKLPLLRCDAARLKRAFAELIENAISFQPEGGAVRVETQLIEPGKGPMEARLSPTRRYVQIEFADAGPGVPAEIKEKIFTPFFTSRVKGMGLGLSIVKGIVDAHQGVIQETGEPGNGARFLIYLPANGGENESNTDRRR